MKTTCRSCGQELELEWDSINNCWCYPYHHYGKHYCDESGAFACWPESDREEI